VEGNVTFHTARSTAYPQPVAGVGAGPGPLKVPADQLPRMLGVTSVPVVIGSLGALALADDEQAEPAVVLALDRRLDQAGDRGDATTDPGRPRGERAREDTRAAGVLGVAAAMLLYEPAFAVIYASFESNARKAITALTLVAGFASTVFWPLTQALVSGLGWRHTLLALGIMNLAICLPLHTALLPPRGAQRARRDVARTPYLASKESRALGEILRRRSFWLLTFAFTANILAFSALSVHLIPLLQEKGFAPMHAVWLAAAVGPMQVTGRLIELTVGRRFSPKSVGLVALALLPFALVALMFASSKLWLGFAFAPLGKTEGAPSSREGLSALAQGSGLHSITRTL
jgi:hypothetical protein